MRTRVVEVTQVGTSDGLSEVLEFRVADGEGLLLPVEGEGTGPKGAHGGDRRDGAIEQWRLATGEINQTVEDGLYCHHNKCRPKEACCKGGQKILYQ